LFFGRCWFGLACVAVLVLSAVLNGDHPTGSFELCPMMHLTGLPCPGCGVTRSMIHCTHGDFAGAMAYHPLGPAVWLAAIIGASSLAWPGSWRRGLGARYRRKRKMVEHVTIGVIVLVIAFGVMRLVFHYVGAPGWWIW
jgi:hypothetical protein